MELPSLSEESSYTKIELPSGKKIGIRPWKVKEERSLLFAIDGQKDLTAARFEVVKMMRKCVDNVGLFDNMSRTDFVWIVTELRKLSKGSKIEFNVLCENPKCKFQLSSDVSVPTDLVVTKFTGGVHKINDLLTFSTKEVSFVDEESLKTSYDKTTEYNYNYVLKSIDTFSYKGEVFTEFTEAELSLAIDSMNSNDFDSLSEFILNSVSEVKLSHEVVCKRCSTVTNPDFGDLFFFISL